MADVVTDETKTALILNSGSSTLKWALLEAPGGKVVKSGTESWSGPDAAEQIRGHLRGLPALDAVGHRVVHGGVMFREAVRLDGDVRSRLDELLPLDRLHLGPQLAGIDAVTAAFPDVPQVLSFDTSFHATMSEAASGYALPHEWSEKWNLRRFGFHGLSVAWSVDRVTALAGGLPERLVVCHLGSGCSVTAVAGGRSVDTTMGFTPLEGLVMSTRVGSIDAGLVLHLVRERGIAPDELLKTLTEKSGLLGTSGVAADLRKVIAAADGGDGRARLAVDRFLLSLRRAMGAAAGVLGGVDAVVFTGGIGENSAQVRRESAPALGLRLDESKSGATPDDVEISASGATPRTFVVHAREEVMVLRDVERLIGWAA